MPDSKEWKPNGADDMRIETTRFGPVDIDESRLIEIPAGLLGFSSYRSFSLLQPDDNGIFFWLQSVEAPDLALDIHRAIKRAERLAREVRSMFGELPDDIVKEVRATVSPQRQGRTLLRVRMRRVPLGFEALAQLGEQHASLVEMVEEGEAFLALMVGERLAAAHAAKQAARAQARIDGAQRAKAAAHAARVAAMAATRDAAIATEEAAIAADDAAEAAIFAKYGLA
jgi:hypothetical protein